MKYPETLFVYICEYDDGKPVWSVANSLDDIPEGDFDNPIARYKLQETNKVVVKREVVKKKVSKS